MEFYTGLAVGISLVSAIGVYLSPVITEHYKSKTEKREIHKNELTIHVLKPLIGKIEYFKRTEFQLSQNQSFDKVPKEIIQRYSKRTFDFVGIEPIYMPISEVGKNDTSWFDKDLFDDLKNHYPQLDKEISQTRSILVTHMPSYVEKFRKLINRLYEVIEPELDYLDKQSNSISAGTNNRKYSSYARTLVTISLLKLFYYPVTQWQDLYENFRSESKLMDIVDKTVEDDDLRKEVDNIVGEIQNKIVESLDNLRNHLNRNVTSGRKLSGNCHYLGK